MTTLSSAFFFPLDSQIGDESVSIKQCMYSMINLFPATVVLLLYRRIIVEFINKDIYDRVGQESLFFYCLF